MRILMVAHSNAPWTHHFCRFFQSRGYDFVVVSFAPFEIDGVANVHMEFVGIEPFDKSKNKHLFLTSVPRIRRIIKQFRPDLVFAAYIISNGLSAVLSFKGPLVVTAVGTDVLEQTRRKGLKRLMGAMLLRFICRRADMVHCLSQQIQNTLTDLGVPASKIIQQPIGVDAEVFHPAPDAPRAEAVRLITIRKHEPVYDNASIIDALALLKDKGKSFHCTFAGDGTLFEKHKERAKNAALDDYVTFLGNLPHEQLPDLFRRGDIYISATHSDGTSAALLEGMATGLMPVVSQIPANEPWIVNGETGLLFEPGNPDQLAKALERAMDDAELRMAAFQKNRLRIEKGGNMYRNMERLADIFEKLVSEYHR